MIRLYILGGVLLVLATSHGVAYLKGRSDCGARHEVAQLEARVTELQRRLDASRGVAEDARAAADRRAAEIDTLNETVADYDEMLRSRAEADRCRIGGDDAERMRSVR